MLLLGPVVSACNKLHYPTTVAHINRNTPPGRPVFRAVALSIFLRTYAAKVGSFERPLSCFLSRRGSPPFVWCFTCGGGSERPPISDLHYKRGVSIKRLNHIDRYPGVPSQPLLGGKQSGLSPDVPNRNPTPYVNMCSYHIERWESQLLTFYAGSLLHPSLEGTSAAFTSWYRSIGCMVFHLCH